MKTFNNHIPFKILFPKNGFIIVILLLFLLSNAYGKEKINAKNHHLIITQASLFYSQSSGDVTQLSSWNTLRNGTGSAPANFSSGDLFVIQAGHSMTTSAAWVLSGAGNKLQIENGGKLTNTFAVTTEYFQIDPGGLFIFDYASGQNGIGADIPGTISRNFSIGMGPDSCGSVEIRKWGDGTGTNPGPLPTGVVWGNIKINVNTLASAWNQRGSFVKVNGTLEFAATGGRQCILTGITVATCEFYNLLVSGGNFSVENGAGTKLNVNILNELSVTGGTFNGPSSTATYFLHVFGNTMVSGGTFNFTDYFGAVVSMQMDKDFIISGGDVSYGTNVPSYSLQVNGNIHVLSGSLKLAGSVSNTNIIIKCLGDMVQSGGLIDFRNGAGIITISGNLDVSVGTFSVNGSTASITCNVGKDMLISNSGTVSNQGNTIFTIKGILDVRNAVFYGSGSSSITHFDIGAGIHLSGTGKIYDDGSISYKIAGDVNIAGSNTTYGIYSTGNGKFIMSCSGDFNLSNGLFQCQNNSSSGGPFALNVGGNFNMTGGVFTGGNRNTILTVTFSGGTSSSISYTQSGGVITTTYPTEWIVDSSKILSLNNQVLLSASSGNTYGSFTVNHDAVLDMGINKIISSGGTLSTIFTALPGSVIKTAYPAGLCMTGNNNGAIQTTGTRTYSSDAAYVFNGNTKQFTGNFINDVSEPNHIYKLMIDNPAGVVDSSGDFIVTNHLGLINGTFDTYTYNKVVEIPEGATIKRFNGWVFGSLKKYVSEIAVFEVGDNASSTAYYTPVIIREVTKFGYVTVKTNSHGDNQNFNIYNSDLDLTLSENTYWTLINHSATFSNGASLSFHYPSENIDEGADPSLFVLGQFNTLTHAIDYYNATATTTSFTATNVSLSDVPLEFQAAVSCGMFSIWKGLISSEWNDAKNWCGKSVPTKTSNVLIPNVVNKPVISTTDAYVKNMVLNKGAGLKMMNKYNLVIADQGSLINSGTISDFNLIANFGAVIFEGSGSIKGVFNFQNIEINGTVDFGINSIVNGIFSINKGSSVVLHAPVYACSSILKYNTGGHFSRGLEWSDNDYGAGYPGHVVIANNTVLNYNNDGAGLSGYTCGDLTIDAGSVFSMNDNHSGSASLTVTGNIFIQGTLNLGDDFGRDINIGGNWIRTTSGIFNPGEGVGRKVSFIGNDASMINAGGGEIFPVLSINKNSVAGKVVLQTPVTIIRNLDLKKGTLDLSNSDMVIKSTIENTAAVSSVSEENFLLNYSGTGRFVIERYIHSEPQTIEGRYYNGRAWRMLTAPISSAEKQTLNASWQEGQTNTDRLSPINLNPGYGTTITNTLSTLATTGYDQAITNNPSVYCQDPLSGNLNAPLNTNATNVNDYPGWLIFIRGDRSRIVKSPPLPNGVPTILRCRGKINKGTIGYIPAKPGYWMLGNPYPAEITLDRIFNKYSESLTPGMSKNYWVWDPNLNGENGVGGYVSVAYISLGKYLSTPCSSVLPNGKIESGQAFLLYFNGTGGMEFNELDKSLNEAEWNEPMVFRPQIGNSSTPILSLALHVFNSSGIPQITDGAAVLFGKEYTNDLDLMEDAGKVANPNENLSFWRENKKISIERRKPISVRDTLFISISGLTNLSAYQLAFAPMNLNQPGLEGVLTDNYLKTKKIFSLKDSTYYPFRVTTDAHSQGDNRFLITFQEAFNLPLPVLFTKINTLNQSDNIFVNWNVQNADAAKEFIVEKSTDGLNFYRVAVVKATGENVYSWVDEEKFITENYYRVKCVGESGSVYYSSIAKAFNKNTTKEIAVNYNALNANKIELLITGMAVGKYTYRLVDGVGRAIKTGGFIYDGGTVLQTIGVENKLAGGIYYLQISGADGYQDSFKLIL